MVRDNLLGFGFMRLPLVDEEDRTVIDLDRVNRMVDAYIDAGYDYFDTGYYYHGGKSEEAIRECVVERYPREKIKIADKLPVFALKSEDDMERIFEEQLERCGVEYFDYYLLHNLGHFSYKGWNDIDSFGFLSRLKEEGKVKHMGFSFHDNAELLDEVLTAHPEMEFVQLQINAMDWENDAIQSRENYEVCLKHGKKVIVMEPFKGGTIINMPEEARAVLKECNNESLAWWALKFFADLDDVCKVLTGASNLEQLEENISIMNDLNPLNSLEKEKLQEAVCIVRESKFIECTECGYCLDDCPVAIPIPRYLGLYNDVKQFGTTYFSTQSFIYKSYSQKNGVGKASDCTECEACVENCPQHLDIPTFMGDVREMFE